MKNPIKAILEFLFGSKPNLNYPADFGIVDFSPIAQQRGIKGDSNKLIYRYFLNSFGNTTVKTYRYSEERVEALKEIHGIPIFDKTQKEAKFPVYSRILPGEIRFAIKQ